MKVVILIFCQQIHVYNKLKYCAAYILSGEGNFFHKMSQNSNNFGLWFSLFCFAIWYLSLYVCAVKSAALLNLNFCPKEFITKVNSTDMFSKNSECSVTPDIHRCQLSTLDGGKIA